jgi:amidase
MTELWQQSASELAAMIAGKEVSSVEVIDAHLARIEQVNAHLIAITRVLSDEARAGAKAADAALSSGDRLGSLHGVPFTVKQNIDLGDARPTTVSPRLPRRSRPSMRLWSSA